MEPFRAKIEKYKQRFPYLKFKSMRLQRKSMLKDETYHLEAINKAYQQVFSTSEAAGKPRGRKLLNTIRSSLKKHSNSYRVSTKSVKDFHVFKPIIQPNDLHSRCHLGQYLRYQQSWLQFLGSDMEAIIMIYYLEGKMLRLKKIRKDQRLKDKSKMKKLTLEAEDRMNDLRTLMCG